MWSRKETCHCVFNTYDALGMSSPQPSLHQVFPELRFKQKYKRKKKPFHTNLDFIDSWYNKCANDLIFSESFVLHINFPIHCSIFIWFVLMPQEANWVVEFLLGSQSKYHTLLGLNSPAMIQSCWPSLPMASDCSSNAIALVERVLHLLLNDNQCHNILLTGICLPGIACSQACHADLKRSQLERKKAELLICGEQFLHHSGSVLPFPLSCKAHV